jgi:glyoxalase family protein
MPSPLTGIHYITALAKDPRKNHTFYTEVLGLGLVKKTVGFDDPRTYHLYHGDDQGSPGTLLTRFAHPHANIGVHGSPEILESVLSVPRGGLSYWGERLGALGVDASLEEREAESRLVFSDHDGIRLAIVETKDSDADYGSIIGIEGVMINAPDVALTRRLLEEVLGFEDAGCGGAATRLVVGQGEPCQRVGLTQAQVDSKTAIGARTVHHVAWRVPDDATRSQVSQALVGAGLSVTPVTDRRCSRSVYFRVPGGVELEVATDGPGFDVDELLESLVTELKLPPQYESRRDSIAAELIPLDREPRYPS